MAEIADADLPVFPFRVNWKNGIAERLEWKTDVLRDLVGNEQRRGLRLTPRREFEATLTVWEQERSFLELWLHRMVGGEFLFPVWHDSVRSAQSAAVGQKTIWVDTQGLEFKIGSYGLLRGISALAWERFQIAEVHADRIVTVANLAYTWPKGTRVEPLLRGRMSDQTRTALVGSRAGETQALFEATRAQPYAAGVEPNALYLGLPVLAPQPNRSDSLDLQHVWEFADSDNDTGRRYRVSEAGRATVAQKHSWFLKGRTAKAAFRSMLYRLQGSRKPIWLPTFNEDLSLAQDAANGATSIYVKYTGFAYTGGVTSGREHIVIETTTGPIYRKIMGTAVAPAGQERLVIDAPLPTGLLRKNVRRISWIDTARLENDRIEFNHVNAADGLSTVSSVFRTFRNERTAPAILSLPIPEADKLNGPCGEDVEQCYEIPSLFVPVFEGWYARARITAAANGAPYPLAGWYVSPNTGPTIFNNAGGGQVVFEEGGSAATVYFFGAAAYGATTVDLRHQFPAGTFIPKWGTFSWQRWDEQFATSLAPFAGDSGGNPFQMGRLFPQNWYFNLPGLIL